MRSWGEVRAWRRSKRAELLARRLELPGRERGRTREVMSELIRTEIADLRDGCIGFYWPFKGEIDLRPLVSACVESGAEAALPVVVEKARPLEFWSWRPQLRLQCGIWDIPIPVVRRVVHPTVLLVPLLGFDAAGYRLGYGGGYYDRSLAIMAPRPLTIGIGHELGRLHTIHPQPHDVPMDAVVTEAGCEWFGYRGEDAVRTPVRRTCYLACDDLEGPA